MSVLVIIPTAGERETLAQTFGSIGEVARVSSVPLHLRVVCPAGARAAVARRCPGVDIEVESGRGVYAAVNQGWTNRPPGTEWLAYINDDDWWLPGMARLLARAGGNVNADILHGDVAFHDAGGRFLRPVARSSRQRDFPALLRAGVAPFTQQAALVRTGIFDRLGGFDERYRLVADSEFWYRAVTGGARCEHVDATCAAYRLHPGQLSADRERQRAEHADMLRRHGGRGSRVAEILAVLRFRWANLDVYLGRARRRMQPRREAGR